MYQIAIVPYMTTGGFLSILDTDTNTIYAAPKSICDAFGIDWRGQQAKLSADASRWQYQTIMINLPEDTQK